MKNDKSLYPKGSEWRKWDLHFHTSASECYEDKSISDNVLVGKLKEAEIVAVAVTDHHKIDINKINNIKKISGNDITVFPGIELRTDKSGSENIHIIGIFSEDCDIEHIWTKLQGKLPLSEKEKEEKGSDRIYVGFKDACNIIHELGGLVSVHAGRKFNSIENITNALPHNEAIKEDLVEFVDIFEIGNLKDVTEYQKNVLPNIKKIKCPPMIICSDNHNINNYSFKNNCWIKADPTFEGLKQIIYEPEQGERVFIGQTKPDKKEKYKVIDKIIFDAGCKFPEEVKFNNNLCSIIGSRSSGKSALLAYMAHGIDEKLTKERMPDGPGAGISWEDIDFSYRVQWSNGLENEKSPGKMVYIPQNYLFRISSQPDEIKEKIEPVFFNLLPDFRNRYFGSLGVIKSHNTNIEDTIDSWFSNADKIKKITDQIKSFGDKSAIEKELKGLENSIEEIKKKFSLTEDDVKKYQSVNSSLKKKEERIRVINSGLIQILSQSENQSENQLENSNNFF
jgi:predicted metal-dependent phosphoesterase TrpH